MAKSTDPKDKKMTEHASALLSEREKKFDPNATALTCIADLRRIQELHPLKFIGRNFYRCNGKYSDSTWDQFFGTFHEFRRQAKLELSRDQHRLEREIAKHASLDVFRKFYNDEVLPYHKKFSRTADQKGRFRTLAVASDFHDLDVDMFVLGAFVDSCRRMQPDVIVLNGDLFDNPEFSKYDQDPREFRVKERFQFVHRHIFAQLRKACPKAQIDMVIGNHEWRILKLIASKTPNIKVILSDVMGLTLSKLFGLDEFEINLVAKVDFGAFNNPDVQEELNENFAVYYNTFAACHFEHKPEHKTYKREG